MGRRLILDSLKFWAKEYGVDGFRFDLMALIDQDTIRQADRELRARMGEAGRRAVLDKSWESVCGELVQYYEAVIASRKAMAV